MADKELQEGSMGVREGSLEAPTRHPIDWQSADFLDGEKLYAELERVYDICHGCRRCVSLCNAFPTLFDLVDESETMEVDGVAKADYMKVADQCYMCDLCYMTKCPYVPPHEWNVDFPHLMLRAKAFKFRNEGARWRDRILTSTDQVSALASLPGVAQTVNALNRNGLFRNALERTLGVHRDAAVPDYHSNTMRKRVGEAGAALEPQPLEGTTGKVALYGTCYGNYNSPDLGGDIFKVFRHNGIQIEMVPRERCCGMPKFELGDLEAVRRASEANIPVLARLVDEGYDLIAPVPSCVLMYKQELPLLFPEDEEVAKVRDAFFDPCEYLFLRHRGGGLDTDFRNSLGDVSYHVACHLRVQNIGLKARDLLTLVPGTTVHPIERCSGHDGTYALKREHREASVKIARPVVRSVDQTFQSEREHHFISDCPMAGNHIANLAEPVERALHPVTLLRQAYGL